MRRFTMHALHPLDECAHHHLWVGINRRAFTSDDDASDRYQSHELTQVAQRTRRELTRINAVAVEANEQDRRIFNMQWDARKHQTWPVSEPPS
jgi:hypothetical protein